MSSIRDAREREREREFCGIVSSMRAIFFSFSLIITMLCCADVATIRSGIVEPGLSQAHNPGRSAMREDSAGR